jgi:hypothetical protein
LSIDVKKKKRKPTELFFFCFVSAYRYSRGVNRFKPIFEAASTSLAQTLRPNAENSALIRAVRAEFGLPSRSSRPYVGVHLRRGDGKGTSWKYKGKYVPVEDYVEEAKRTWTRLSAANDKKNEARIYLASDSPSAQDDFIQRLADTDFSVFSLTMSRQPELRALASPKEYVQEEFALFDPDVRIRATRGVIVDFALVSGIWPEDEGSTPIATVCTIGYGNFFIFFLHFEGCFATDLTSVCRSNMCRLSAIGLGWERAFGPMDVSGNIVEKAKGWVEIDNKNQVSPEWQAFQLF